MKEWQRLKELEREILLLEQTSALVEWDMETKLPPDGHAWRSEQIALLSQYKHRLQTTSEWKSLLTQLQEKEGLSPLQKRSLFLAEDRYKKSIALPEEHVHKKSLLTAKAHSVWADARKRDDFSLFEPMLTEIVELVRKESDYLGYEENPYDALLDLYEPKMTVSQLDPLFENVGKRQSSLLQQIQESEVFRQQEEWPSAEYPFEKQRELGGLLQEWLGYKQSSGRLDTTEHPFCTTLGLNDVRITTKYHSDSCESSLYSVLHEVGHALYEQNILPEYEGSFLAEGVSLGIHESQSRFWENMVGRSKGFVRRLYPELKRLFPEPMKGMKEETLHRLVNRVQPSLIRIEADEVSYNLHIILRYQIEKGLINQEFQVEDIPSLWAELSRKLLGIEPQKASQGALQDVHWSFGGFGYFPTYALGNLYSAQFQKTMEKEIHLTEVIESGDFSTPREWLTKNIYQHGSLYSPSDLCERVTGETLNAEYYGDYLEKKFKGLYGLSL